MVRLSQLTSTLFCGISIQVPKNQGGCSGYETDNDSKIIGMAIVLGISRGYMNNKQDEKGRDDYTINGFTEKL